RVSFSLYLLSLLCLRPPPRSPLFPYTTLFRSYQPTFVVDPGVADPGAPYPDPFPRYPKEVVDFSLGGSYSMYNWELFFFAPLMIDRKSTRLNSSHQIISYAVFCLKKKKKNVNQ